MTFGEDLGALMDEDQISTEHVQMMNWAASKSIVKSNGQKCPAPNAPLIRAEAATILQRFYELMK